MSATNKVPSTPRRRNFKTQLYFYVRPTVHTNPSGKHSFSKTLFKPEKFENAGFAFYCKWKTFWKRNFRKRWHRDNNVISHTEFFWTKMAGNCCVLKFLRRMCGQGPLIVIQNFWGEFFFSDWYISRQRVFNSMKNSGLNYRKFSVTNAAIFSEISGKENNPASCTKKFRKFPTGVFRSI